MARKIESGISYFPMNTDVINNTKIKLVVSEFGSKTWAVLLPLLCKIYDDKGYWLDWCDNDAVSLFVLDEVKEPESFVREVVNGFVRRSFFDKKVFDKFGILTSKRIQENYLEATKRRKTTDFIHHFNLLKDDVYKLNQNVNIIDLNVNIISKNVSISTQSKVNKNKVKESKREQMENRKQKFASTLKPFLETYGKDMLNDFYAYWTEPNKSNTKVRFELEKTWSLKRRLGTWAKNDKNFNKVSVVKETEEEKQLQKQDLIDNF